MKCIVLAAGYATRLYPLTKNFPKPLLDVGGKSILDRLIDDLMNESQIDEYIIVSNHKFIADFENWKNKKEIFAKNAHMACRITVIDDGTETNEGRLGAVKDIQLAAKRFAYKEDALIMAGDNLLDFSLSGFIQFAKNADAPCIMCYEERNLENRKKTGIITVNADGKILSFEEKSKEPKGKLAVPPFYYYRADDLIRLEEALVDGCGYDAPGSFAMWLYQKTPIYAYRMPGNRYDVGDLKSYEAVKAQFVK